MPRKSDSPSKYTKAAMSARSAVATHHEPLCVNIVDACALLSVSRARFYQLLEAGEIESFRSGRSRSIPLAALRAWMVGRLEAAKSGREG